MIILETGVDDNLHETIHTKSILANYNTSIWVVSHALAKC
jgi:hypothetical protein